MSIELLSFLFVAVFVVILLPGLPLAFATGAVAVFFAVALGAMPERAKPIMGLIDDLAHIMLKVTAYVMLFAPIAVWAAIMATVSKNGLGVLWKLIVFMGGFYLSLMILWGILVIVGFIVIGPRYSHLLRLIREPLMIAFSTASSEAAYPKTLEGLNRFGASSRISTGKPSSVASTAPDCSTGSRNVAPVAWAYSRATPRMENAYPRSGVTLISTA